MGGPVLLTRRIGPLPTPLWGKNSPSFPSFQSLKRSLSKQNPLPHLYGLSPFSVQSCVWSAIGSSGVSHIWGTNSSISLTFPRPLVFTQACGGGRTDRAMPVFRGLGGAPQTATAGQWPQSWNLKSVDLDPKSSALSAVPTCLEGLCSQDLPS